MLTPPGDADSERDNRPFRRHVCEMLKTWVAAFLAGLFGLATGWMLHPAPDLAGALDKQKAAETKASPSRGDWRDHSTSSGHAARLINGQFSSASGANLFHAGLEVLSANEDQLRELAEQLRLDPAMNSNEYQVMFEAVYTRWAELNPEAALAAAMKEMSWQRANAVGFIVGTITRSDPDGAWAIATTLEPSILRKHAKEAALAALAKTDPKAAFDLFQQDPSVDSNKGPQRAPSKSG